MITVAELFDAMVEANLKSSLGITGPKLTFDNCDQDEKDFIRALTISVNALIKKKGLKK